MFADTASSIHVHYTLCGGSFIMATESNKIDKMIKKRFAVQLDT